MNQCFIQDNMWREYKKPSNKVSPKLNEESHIYRDTPNPKNIIKME